MEPWRVDLSRINWQRYVWNMGAIVRGGTGGFQYSKWFLDLAEKQISIDLRATEIITFNQHFPRARTVIHAGGILNHYLDAPFVALASARGLDLHLPKSVVKGALALERENYAASQRIIAMARWAAEAVVRECGVPEAKVHVILPGANLKIPTGWNFPFPSGRPGRERDFVLGFIGKDWRRKGLPLLVSVRDELKRRGWRTHVLAAGEAPPKLQRREGVEFAGFIDKCSDPASFLNFLTACDVGCLFSEREAFGISILEFLRAGVPVAGFAHEGPADSLPPDAGFRFSLGTGTVAVADQFEKYLQDELKQAEFRKNARRWSELVTWERCVHEFQELWATGTIAHPVEPWRGLGS